jgi:RNA recognition motif-containing protein
MNFLLYFTLKRWPSFVYSTDNERLGAFFSRFGKVNDCHVMLDKEGKSRCRGFVNYEGKVKLRKTFRKNNLWML